MVNNHDDDDALVRRTVTRHWCVEARRGGIWEPNAARWEDKEAALRSLRLWQKHLPTLPVRLVRVETTTVRTVTNA